jgi:N6-adenosine-specific RNA methylase IME4
MFSYGRIIADPPWRFLNYSAKGEAKNPVAHYGCMSLESMKEMPVNHLAAPDCALFMWAVAPMLPEAIDLMAAWAKQSSTLAEWAFGTGYIFRSAAELVLVSTRRKPALHRQTLK